MVKWLDAELTITLVNALVAVFVGYLSFIINIPFISAIVGILVMVGMTLLLKATVKEINEPFKWWVNSSMFIFLFTWFITWTIFYNTRII